MPRQTARSRNGGRAGTVTDTGTAREGRRGQNRDGNSERGGRRKRGGQRGPGSKRHMLVEDVSKNWESYKGEGAD